MESTARGAPGERLSAADASNFVIDAADQVNAFLLVGLLGSGGFVAGPDAIDLDRLRAHVAARVADPSREGLVGLRRRVGTQRPLAWEACEPDLTWHVRLADPVAGTDGLARLAAQLMTEPLRRDRPLWELLVVPGAAERGAGIILRLHHAVTDGVGAVRLAGELFGDAAPAAADGAQQTPGAAPSPAAGDRRQRRGSTALMGLRRILAMLRTRVPPTVLLGPIGPHRVVALIEADLATLAAAARAHGATVNDTLLAAVGAAVETALRAEGLPVPDELPASVPVALGERGSSGNAVGVMVVPLPTGQLEPATRLARIAAVSRSSKDAARAAGTLEITRTRWGSRAFMQLARRQRLVALFVTNVRGPRERLCVVGAPLERAWPVTPIQGNVRLGVAAMSYAGRLGVAIHADGDAIPVEAVGRALEDELLRLGALA